MTLAARANDANATAGRNDEPLDGWSRSGRKRRGCVRRGELFDNPVDRGIRQLWTLEGSRRRVVRHYSGRMVFGRGW